MARLYGVETKVLNQAVKRNIARFPQNFPYVNDYRNSIVAEALKVLGFVNRFSRGVIRVKEELLENGNGDPQFSLDLVTAFLVVESISTKVLSLGEKDRNEDRKDRNEDRTILTSDHVNVYNAIKLQPTIKYDQLMDNLGLSKSKVYHIITVLKESRYIERKGGTKRPKWEILKELKA